MASCLVLQPPIDKGVQVSITPGLETACEYPSSTAASTRWQSQQNIMQGEQPFQRSAQILVSARIANKLEHVSHCTRPVLGQGAGHVIIMSEIAHCAVMQFNSI
eukprot:9129999-Karenia_brevis.AAC.1